MGGESKLTGMAAMITAIVGLLTFYYTVYLPSQKPQPPATQPPAIPTQYSFVLWGSEGKGDGQLNAPAAIAVDPKIGSVYVADGNSPLTTYHCNCIKKFTADGNFITKWGSSGTGEGQFDNVLGVAVDLQGSVYVVDLDNHRIQKFDSNGNFITELESWNAHIAVNSSGNIYGAVEGRTRPIQVFVPKT
jgi:DNA-binding beta-propeller fold protein YncE